VVALHERFQSLKLLSPHDAVAFPMPRNGAIVKPRPARWEIMTPGEEVLGPLAWRLRENT